MSNSISGRAHQMHVTGSHRSIGWFALGIVGLALVVWIALRVPVTPTAAQATGDLTVYAASSLTDAFNDLGPVFEQQYPGSHVVFNYGASSTLRTQLEQGAPADVFASADQRQMDMAVAAGVVIG